LEHYVPSTTVTAVHPEILFVSRLLYYGIFYSAGNNRTPGESYCGLTMVQLRSASHPHSTNDENGKSAPASVSMMSSADQYKLYALIVLLPYIYSRKDAIMDSCKATLRDCMSLYISADASPTMTTEQDPRHVELTRRIKAAVAGVCAFVEEVHRCVFCLDGR
jgi:hypothetical protein